MRQLLVQYSIKIRQRYSINSPKTAQKYIHAFIKSTKCKKSFSPKTHEAIKIAAQQRGALVRKWQSVQVFFSSLIPQISTDVKKFYVKMYENIND